MKIDWKSFGIGAPVGGIAVFLFTLTTGQSTQHAKESTTSVQGPGGFSMSNTSKGRDDFATSLGLMFNDPTIKPQAIAWLESHAQLYAPTAVALPDAIARTACDAFPKGVSPEALEAKRQCAEKENVRKLRKLASEHESPFHYVGALGKMGVPAGSAHQPQVGYANACRPGDFHGKRLQVATTDGGGVIEVTASGAYVCTDAIPTPDIQLSPEDAVKLFANRALAKTEDVIIVPLE